MGSCVLVCCLCVLVCVYVYVLVSKCVCVSCMRLYSRGCVCTCGCLCVLSCLTRLSLSDAESKEGSSSKGRGENWDPRARRPGLHSPTPRLWGDYSALSTQPSALSQQVELCEASPPPRGLHLQLRLGTQRTSVTPQTLGGHHALLPTSPETLGALRVTGA